MLSFDGVNVTPHPGYVIDEAKERNSSFSNRLLNEIAMMQQYEHHVDPMFREFHQNVKARLGLLCKDLNVLESNRQESEDVTRPG